MTIGIILAGGQSSRFKQGDKALYADWAELAFAKLSALLNPQNPTKSEKADIFVSANPRNAAQLASKLPEARILLDSPDFAGEGPLSAFYAASKNYEGKQDYLVLSVDNPELSLSSLKLLLAAPNCYAQDHYCICHLAFSHQQISDFLTTGNRRVKKFLLSLKAEPIALPEAELINHNEN